MITLGHVGEVSNVVSEANIPYSRNLIFLVAKPGQNAHRFFKYLMIEPDHAYAAQLWPIAQHGDFSQVYELLMGDHSDERDQQLGCTLPCI